MEITYTGITESLCACSLVVVQNNGMVSEYKHELDFSREDTYTKHTLYLQQTVSDEVEEGVRHISL